MTVLASCSSTTCSIECTWTTSSISTPSASRVDPLHALLCSERRWAADAAGPRRTCRDYRRVHCRCPLRVTQTTLCQQLGQMGQYLTCRHGRSLHPPDALIEPVFGRHYGLRDLDGDCPSSHSLAFFVSSSPPPLRAPPRWPPRRPGGNRLAAPRTCTQGSFTVQNGPLLCGHTKARVPTSTEHSSTPIRPLQSFVLTEPLTACARGVWPSSGGPRDPLSSARLPASRSRLRRVAAPVARARRRVLASPPCARRLRPCSRVPAAAGSPDTRGSTHRPRRPTSEHAKGRHPPGDSGLVTSGPGCARPQFGGKRLQVAQG